MVPITGRGPSVVAVVCGATVAVVAVVTMVRVARSIGGGSRNVSRSAQTGSSCGTRRVCPREGSSSLLQGCEAPGIEGLQSGVLYRDDEFTVSADGSGSLYFRRSSGVEYGPISLHDLCAHVVDRVGGPAVCPRGDMCDLSVTGASCPQRESRCGGRL